MGFFVGDWIWDFVLFDGFFDFFFELGIGMWCGYEIEYGWLNCVLDFVSVIYF